MRTKETPEGRSVRLLRVGEQVRHVLSELLQRGDVHDDVLQSHLVSVTEVRMSPASSNNSASVKAIVLPRRMTRPLATNLPGRASLRKLMLKSMVGA